MNPEDFDDHSFQREEFTHGNHEKPSTSKLSTPHQQRRCCNCKQSRCIKLYCECFAAGVYCNQTCNCVDCWNNPQYENHRKAAIKSTLEKNPNAFQPKISNSLIMEQKHQDSNFIKHSKGCACKKSSCMKKYCECFQAQIPCSDLCKCVDCHNNKEYYDTNKVQSVMSDYGRPEDLSESNSFFFKFLLAAGEPDSPGKSMKIPSLNKKLNTSLSQEVLDQLYERLMRIINLPVDEYLENENYAKEIESYNSDLISLRKGSNIKTQENKKVSTGNNEVIEENKNEKMEEETEPKLDAEQDDLICDEEVEEINLKPNLAKEKEENSQQRKESQMEIEEIQEEEKSDLNGDSNQEKKLSLYKIKKTRIIREFIAVLRELDS